MAISSRSALKLQVLSRFPSRAVGAGGITVVKVNGYWIIQPKWEDLIQLAAVSDGANVEVWVRNTQTGIYNRMTLQALINSISQAGAGYSINYTVDLSSIADADPGNGKLRFNNAAQNVATTLFVDLADTAGMTWTTALDSLDDSSAAVKGQWSLFKIGESSKRLVGTLSAVTNAAGYRKLVVTVTGSSTASPFQNGDSVIFAFTRTGDAGTVSGNVGATDNVIVRTDGVGGTQVQGSIPTLEDDGSVRMTEMAAPATPPANKVAIYPKADGLYYSKADDGIERLLSLHAAFGQCMLQKSGANLILLPKNGHFLLINGVLCTVPMAGVTLAATSLTPGTRYYIYAVATAGVVTSLEASTTAPVVDATWGNKIKTGDATRVLVGQGRIITGPAWQDTMAQRFVRSWFNPTVAGQLNNFATDRSTAGTSFTEINTEIRLEALLWAGETWQVQACGALQGDGVFTMFSRIAFDGAGEILSGVAFTFGAANYNGSGHSAIAKTNLSEDYHYATIFGRVVSGTGTWRAAGTDHQFSLSGLIY